MPYLQGMAERMNTAMNRVNIAGVDPALFEPGKDLVAAAQALGIAAGDTEQAYLNSMPRGMKEAVRATIYDALIRTPRLPVQVTWAAGYDWELGLFESAGTADSIGGVTLNLRGRYPNDAIPGVLPG